MNIKRSGLCAGDRPDKGGKERKEVKAPHDTNKEEGRRLPKGLSGTGMRVDLKGSPKDRLLALRPERSYGGNISVSSTEGKGPKRLNPGECFADKRGIDRRSPVSTAEERRP